MNGWVLRLEGLSPREAEDPKGFSAPSTKNKAWEAPLSTVGVKTTCPLMLEHVRN